MADFNFTVSTEPLAREVGTVSHHVTGVTVAVTAMQTAVIAAEKASAETICTNVDRGFYFLVKSQISQKAARLSSEVTSKLMVLGQLAVALKGVKRQMEGDYRMITSRYIKLFKGLDANLRTRVAELDKDATRLSLTGRSELWSRQRDFGGTYLLHQSESVPTGQSAATSKLKRNALKGIDSLSRQLGEELFLTAQLENVVTSRSIAGQRHYTIPVVLSEADSLVGAGRYSSIFAPTSAAAFHAVTGTIEVEIAESLREASWAPRAAGTTDSVREAFVSRLDAESSEDRVKKEMLRLFDEGSGWLELAGGQS